MIKDSCSQITTTHVYIKKYPPTSNKLKQIFEDLSFIAKKTSFEILNKLSIKSRLLQIKFLPKLLQNFAYDKPHHLICRWWVKPPKYSTIMNMNIYFITKSSDLTFVPPIHIGAATNPNTPYTTDKEWCLMPKSASHYNFENTKKLHA